MKIEPSEDLSPNLQDSNDPENEDWKKISSKLQRELLAMKNERNKYFKEMTQYRTLYCKLVKKHEKTKLDLNSMKKNAGDVRGEDENGEEEQHSSNLGNSGF